MGGIGGAGGMGGNGGRAGNGTPGMIKLHGTIVRADGAEVKALYGASSAPEHSGRLTIVSNMYSPDAAGSLPGVEGGLLTGSTDNAPVLTEINPYTDSRTPLLGELASGLAAPFGYLRGNYWNDIIPFGTNTGVQFHVFHFDDTTSVFNGFNQIVVRNTNTTGVLSGIYLRAGDAPPMLIGGPGQAEGTLNAGQTWSTVVPAALSVAAGTLPELTPIADAWVENGVLYEINTTVTGTGPFTWSIVSPNPAPAGLIIDSVSGVVKWTTNYLLSPLHITIRVENGIGSDTTSWYVNVTAPPEGEGGEEGEGGSEGGGEGEGEGEVYVCTPMPRTPLPPAPGNFNFCGALDTIYCSLEPLMRLVPEIADFANLVRCDQADINGPVNPEAEIPVSGNGMLDAYELAVIAMVLNDTGFNLNGLTHQMALDAFQNNYTAIRSLLVNALTSQGYLGLVNAMAPYLVSGLSYTLAGYTLIGDADTMSAITQLVGLLAQIGITPPDPSIFQTLPAWFAPDQDADRDGCTNREEYVLYAALGAEVYATNAWNSGIHPAGCTGATEGEVEGGVEGEGGSEGGVEGEGGSEGEGVLEGEGETPNPGRYSADQNDDGVIGLSELLRVIQFYNSGGFHCQAGTEDGYAPGPGDTACDQYDSDYYPQDWRISLSELLRVIQFFNSGGYHACPEENTEDGFCPGLA